MPRIPGRNRDVFPMQFEPLERRQLLAGTGFPIVAGGTGSVDVNQIRGASNGNVIVVGSFQGTVDFNPAGGAVKVSAGVTDAFLAVYASNGRFRWVVTWGGAGDEAADSVAIDPTTKNIVVAGHHTSRFTFPIGAGSQRVGVAGVRDIHVATISAAGAGISLQQFGQTGSMFVEDVEVSGGGLVGVTGFFNGSFDADPHATRTNLRTSPASRDAGFAFILKTNRTLFWAAGAQIADENVRFNDAAFDPMTEAFIVVGEATNTFDILSTSGTTRMTTGNFNAMAIKFDRSGNLVYSRAIAGNDLIAAYGVVVDRAGSAYFTGEYADSADLDTGSTKKIVFQSGSDSTGSAFLVKLSTTGRFVWGNAVSGDAFVLSEAISFNSDGNIAIAGAFSGTADFNPGASTNTLTARRFVDSTTGRSSPGVDVFTAQYRASDGTFLAAQRTGGTAREFASTVTLDGTGFLYTDFEPLTGTKRTMVMRWAE